MIRWLYMLNSLFVIEMWLNTLIVAFTSRLSFKFLIHILFYNLSIIIRRITHKKLIFYSKDPSSHAHIHLYNTTLPSSQPSFMHIVWDGCHFLIKRMNPSPHLEIQHNTSDYYGFMFDLYPLNDKHLPHIYWVIARTQNSHY